MPRLVLLNGAPGAGKSTLARRYVDDHPLTLALDVDVVRAMLGGWLDSHVEAGLLARALALGMARVHLLAGRDVVVPQFLGRPDHLLDLERVSVEVGASFVEVALVSSVDDAVARFRHRAADPQRAEHRDASALLDRLGGVDELPRMHARLMAVVAQRPATRVVETVTGDVDGAYAALLRCLEDVGPAR